MDESAAPFGDNETGQSAHKKIFALALASTTDFFIHISPRLVISKFELVTWCGDKEVKDEIRPNNKPFLEDELGDILWGWLVLVEKLKSKGLVTSHEAVIKRALKKYTQRIGSINGDSGDKAKWEAIKAKQKQELLEELRG